MTNPNDSVDRGLAYNRETGKFNGLHKGLTKREYFAAIAMQGMLAYGSRPYTPKGWAELATDAIKSSDALIEALNQVE